MHVGRTAVVAAAPQPYLLTSGLTLYDKAAWGTGKPPVPRGKPDD